MRDKYLDFVRESKKLWNMRVTVIPIVIIDLGTVTKRLVQRLEDLEITGWVETIQTTAFFNIEKSPRDLRGHAVTQIPVKDRQLTQMGKSLKE